MLPQCKSRKRRADVQGLFRDYMMITGPLLFHNSSLDFNHSSPAEDGLKRKICQSDGMV